MIGCRVCLKSRCAPWDTHQYDMERAVIGEITFFGGSGNERYAKLLCSKALSESAADSRSSHPCHSRLKIAARMAQMKETAATGEGRPRSTIPKTKTPPYNIK